ncbi:ankyrin repeat-containing domain protein [Truncatella angustata]|uniref:Ankyrin repeat-containing domain protein n=1 Tax=Truncatella angustata TaxID=152316 RepID=A0A9P8UJT0_9PEZI|nr:ankyrin repeat-containing domain protein [Truncatella angustata]KAH6653785.1 ankyrin repeat-containing domain protein [Truncatella angustata]KAH8194521.1 hypothetical protein TruAng_011320 [Truncatella angustata]
MSFDDCFLLGLPAELLLLIIDGLSRQRDLAAWCQTNHYFHSKIGPILYENEIARNDWYAVFWAAEHGRVGTLKQWIAVRNRDDSFRAPIDVYRTKYRSMLIRENEVHDPNLRLDDEYILGPLDQRTRQRHHFIHAPLHIAAKNGHANAVEFLIEHGADINAQSLGFMYRGLGIFNDARDRHSSFDENCITLNALHIAIIMGQAEVAKVLLQRSIDLKVAPLRAEHESNITAFHLAAAHATEDLDVLRIIGKRPDVDVNAPDIDGQTPIMYAAEDPLREFPAFPVLKELGADIDCIVRTRDGIEAPLLVALIRRIRWKAAVKLIDAGANLEVEGGRRPLLEECQRAKMSVIHPEVLDLPAYRDLITRVERRVNTPSKNNLAGNEKPHNLLRRVVNLVRR